MSKFLTSFLGNKSAGGKNTRPHVTLASADGGRLETDALPVSGTTGVDSGLEPQSFASIASTPSVFVDMTGNEITGVADSNYNSIIGVTPQTGGDLTMVPNGLNASIMAERTSSNIHSAQQQLIMQFSNVNQLHFGSVYNFHSNQSKSTPACSDDSNISSNEVRVNESRRLTPRKTTSVVAMMQSQQEPDHRMLEAIATHLGEGWKLVMRNLGHSEGQIEQAIIDHQMHGGIKEVIYQLLLLWVRNAEDGEATISRITTLLWEMNHRECVQRMKLVFKSSAEQKGTS